jgi:hypothetical protein
MLTVELEMANSPGPEFNALEDPAWLESLVVWDSEQAVEMHARKPNKHASRMFLAFFFSTWRFLYG